MKNSRYHLKNIEILLFLLVLTYAGYFLGPQLVNSNSRYDAIYSVVEDGSAVPWFSIDKYIFSADRNINTNDWSYYNGHYYSNKAPGSILLGIPVYYIIVKIQKFLSLDLDFPPIAYLNVYLINFFVSILPLALACICFYRFAARLTNKNLELTLLLIFCTPLIPYSTSFWGHGTACSFLIIGIYYLNTALAKRDYLLSGFFLTLACAVDYFAVLAVLVIALQIISKHFKMIPYLVIGAILPTTATLLYHYICFGSIFSTSTTYTNGVFLNENLFLGMFGMPKLFIIGLLLAHPTHGLLVMLPIYILSLFSIALKQFRKNYIISLMSLAIIITYVLSNSSFNGWHSGMTVFSRYLIISSPFWIILLYPYFALKNLLLKFIFIVMAVISAVNILVTTAVTTIPDIPTSNPLYGLIYPMFLDGNLSYVQAPIRRMWFDINLFLEYKHLSSWNMGQLIGLEGHASLIPLLIIILGLLVLLSFCSKQASHP